MASSTTTPTRFDAALFEAAQTAGARMHRSAAQQLAHWARLGRELEASASLSNRDIERVLAGQMSYDELADRDQAVVRTAWHEGFEQDLAKLDLREEFEHEGRTRWSEADDAGRVTVHAAEEESDDRPQPATSTRDRPRTTVREKSGKNPARTVKTSGEPTKRTPMKRDASPVRAAASASKTSGGRRRTRGS